MPEPLGPGAMVQSRFPLTTWDEIDWARPEDLHMHTTHVDGTASVAMMADAAAGRGLRRILLTEHIRADSVYFPEFAAEIRAVRKCDFTAYVGAETKICSLDGDLDISESHASACDALVGSVHRPPPEMSGGAVKWSVFDAKTGRDLEFRLAMAIVEKSRATILGHPMGMSFKAYNVVAEPELRELAKSCARHGKAFEFNIRYCPEPALWVRIARDAGCLVTISSDAHSPQELGRAWSVFSELQ